MLEVANKAKHLKSQKCKKSGPKATTELRLDGYSQTRSQYYSTRELLPAAFPPWAVPLLFNQPGEANLRQPHHIDAEFTVDVRST